MKNIKAPRLDVMHGNLRRHGKSVYRSFCPACSAGILPMRRNVNCRLSKADWCVLCGQRVHYLDLEVNGEKLEGDPFAGYLEVKEGETPPTQWPDNVPR